MSDVPLPRAVIFDMDGLLLDSERICMGLFAQVCEEFGFQFRREVYARCIGTTRSGTRSVMIDGYGEGFPYDAVESEWMQRYEARVLAEPVDLKAGVLELLTALEQVGAKLAIATSTEASVAQRKLELSGLQRYFAVRVTGDQVTRGKPDPEPYREALFRLAEPAQYCWALEDSDNGVRSAIGAGLTVFQVPDLSPPSRAVRELGHRVVDSLHDVRRLLGDEDAVSET